VLNIFAVGCMLVAVLVNSGKSKAGRAELSLSFASAQAQLKLSSGS